jgi:CYTH domain-containing protein
VGRGAVGEPVREGKYARVERERRFLLAEPPVAAAVVAIRRITDRYLTGTRLRLRRVERADDGSVTYKLTQKVPADRPGPVQGLITNTYLSRAEYDLLATLPATRLAKTRLSVPPLGIDLFDPPLHGLILAEAEFTTDAAAHAFRPPPACLAEVTADPPPHRRRPLPNRPPRPARPAHRLRPPPGQHLMDRARRAIRPRWRTGPSRRRIHRSRRPA